MLANNIYYIQYVKFYREFMCIVVVCVFFDGSLLHRDSHIRESVGSFSVSSVSSVKLSSSVRRGNKANLQSSDMLCSDR